MSRLFMVIGCIVAAILIADSVMHDPDVHPFVDGLVRRVDRKFETWQGRFGAPATPTAEPTECRDMDPAWVTLTVTLPRREANPGDVITASASDLTLLVIVRDVTPTGRIRVVDLLGSLPLTGAILGAGEDAEFVEIDPPESSITGLRTERRSPFRDLSVCYEGEVGPIGATPVRTPSPLPTATGTDTPAAPATETAVSTATESLPATTTSTWTPQPAATETTFPTATETVAPTATSTPSATVDPTATPTAVPTSTATRTPAPTNTATLAPSATETVPPTVTETAEPTATETAPPTATSTAAPTGTPEPTSTSTPVPTSTETMVPTSTATAAPTETPVPTSTATATATATEMATATEEPVPTSTATAIETATEVPMDTPTPVPTETMTAAATVPPTATDTAVPSETASPIPPPTVTATVEPSSTATAAPTSTATALPSDTPDLTASAPSTPVSTETAAPSETAAQLATNSPTTAPSETPTAGPSATASPVPTATPLFETGEGGSFAGWTLAEGWSSDGALMTNGQAKDVGWVAPPVTVGSTNDYGVEFEFVLGETDECPRSFGAAIRGTSAGYIAGGIEWNCDAEALIWIGQERIATAAIDLEPGSHTMRVQAVGDQATVFLDGQIAVEATTDVPSGDQVGFWSAGVPITITNVRIVDLSGTEGAAGEHVD